MSEPVTEAMLHAYADDRLPETGRTVVEAYLATHPERANDIAAWRRQNAAINGLYPADSSIPARLDVEALSRRPRPVSILARAAAAVVLIGLGGALGWTGRTLLPAQAQPYDRLMASAMTAHALYAAEKRHAVEVAASEKDHLVTWLSNRIERPLGAPDLTAQGFTLVGGRLLPPETGTETGPAGQLMYENATADRVTVYVTAAITGGPSYELGGRDGLAAFYWANGQITCTVVGDLPSLEMDSVAKSIYRQMRRRPDEVHGL